MTGNVFRKLALALPGAVETPHFERASFRVGKKIFATLSADGKEAMIPVKPLDFCQALLTSHPETFFSFGGWTARLGSLGVHLLEADTQMVKNLLNDAWQRMAPKAGKVNSERPKQAKRRSYK